jgi:hypothetical protein
MYVVLTDWTFIIFNTQRGRSHWPSCLRRGSAAAPLLGLWVRILRGCGCLFWVLCVVRLRSLRRADDSSRGVLPIGVCPCMFDLQTSRMAALAHVGLLRQRGGGVHNGDVRSWSRKKVCVCVCVFGCARCWFHIIQGGSNMTGTNFYFFKNIVPVIFEPPCILYRIARCERC